MRKHNWVITNSLDHRKRKCIHCPSCGATSLVGDIEFKYLLDQKGCNNLSRDFDEIYYVYIDNGYGLINYGSSLTLVGIIEMASFASSDGYGYNKRVMITDQDKNDLEVYILGII